MLQQTGTERVLGKYGPFLAAFPDPGALSRARVSEVLGLWKGLGYNRRALYLWKAAAMIQEAHAGRVPRSAEALTALPGVGEATACAVLTFAFGLPSAFIETNIRRVFLHSFFPGASAVRDSEILPLVEKTMDREDPREWFYALMDYGAMLKTTLPNPNRRSAHYQRQAAFEGSVRQMRGRILGLLLKKGRASLDEICADMQRDPAAGLPVLEAMRREGFLVRRGRTYLLP
jgi:A/G-specific adenine glycosylase